MANKRFNGQYNSALKRIPLISEAIPTPKPQGASKGAAKGVTAGASNSIRNAVNAQKASNASKIARDVFAPAVIGGVTGGAMNAHKKPSTTRGSVKPRTKSTK